ncbi:helix-turn-helix domain-containing protein [Paenibacillus odorifer]|uniref:helix-turn-helix domain-containing protein n=1 Tax=Paenibacillus odorifer TaxID=189426 RepID=UPI00289D5DD9|nr:helix-turn-helix domain-containing protein [Paenibacillus odorifer]
MKPTEKKVEPLSHELPMSVSNSYLYIPSAIHLHHSLAYKFVLPVSATAHRIVCFIRSGGIIYLKGHSVHMDKGSSVLLAPGAYAEIEFDVQEELQGTFYTIDFLAYRLGEQQPALEIGTILPYESRIDANPFSRLVDLMDRFTLTTSNTWIMKDEESFKQQVCLQELLVFLMDNCKNSHTLSDPESAVEQTINYINHHYREEITVEMLYKLSGVARWQYSTLFHSLTGKKPLDYLTDVRLKRAKELLLRTDDPLREIARRVGFKEESYFSRKFKQTLGMTPREYIKAMQAVPSSEYQERSRYSRIVAVGYALGDLLALGIRPIGADINVIGKRVVYREELTNIEDIGLLGEPGKIRALKPDLILYSSFRQDWIEELSQIAPTIVIDRYEPTYIRLLKVAEILQKQDQAQHWIEHHKKSIEIMWEQLSPQSAEQRTASIFIIVDGNLYVMGMKGIGLTLYHPLGFLPSSKVKEMIDIQLPFRMINIGQISEYQADTHFLLINDDERSKQAKSHLTNSSFWNRHGEKYAYVLEAKWNHDDPITMQKLLSVLPRILV